MTGILYLIGLWLCISLLAWPAYVLSSTLCAHVQGEAWQLDAWNQIPRALMLEHFLADYKRSWIVSIPIGFIAVIDYVLLSRYKSTWLVGGIFLPLAGVVIAFLAYQQPMAVLPVLVGTGVILAIVYRLIDIIARASNQAVLR